MIRINWMALVYMIIFAIMTISVIAIAVNEFKKKRDSLRNPLPEFKEEEKEIESRFAVAENNDLLTKEDYEYLDELKAEGNDEPAYIEKLDEQIYVDNALKEMKVSKKRKKKKKKPTLDDYADINDDDLINDIVQTTDEQIEFTKEVQDIKMEDLQEEENENDTQDTFQQE